MLPPDPGRPLALRDTVQQDLAEFLDGQGPRLGAVASELSPVLDAARALLEGGKRLRPAFCTWGFLGALEPDPEVDLRAVVRGAASLELLHACALVHDDVMDGSDTRRGQPAQHRRFASLHRESDWHGDPEAFGTSAAILLGDLCLIWADEMLGTSGLPPAARLRAAPVYDRMRVELMGGQYLDLLEQVVGGASLPRALRVARYKSAGYTVEGPLHLGAALAGAPPELLETYSAYGVPLGEAFQLRDDILGTFGDPEQTGKPAGDDLREGKRTALVACALEKADDAQEGVVRRHLGDPHLSERGIRDLRQVLRDTGALERVEGMVAERHDAALHALGSGDLDEPARQALTTLAEAATQRSV